MSNQRLFSLDDLLTVITDVAEAQPMINQATKINPVEFQATQNIKYPLCITNINAKQFQMTKYSIIYNIDLMLFDLLTHDKINELQAISDLQIIGERLIKELKAHYIIQSIADDIIISHGRFDFADQDQTVYVIFSLAITVPRYRC